MCSLMLLLPAALLLCMTVGASAVWEYSVACPPSFYQNPRSYVQCDVVLLPIDQPATVTISTASSTEVLQVDTETRWTAPNMIVHGGIELKGIIVRSDVQITVVMAYFHPTDQNTQDATVIEPVSPYQTSFYISNHLSRLHYCDSMYVNDFFSIAAVSNNTVVTVFSPIATYSVTLNQFNTYSEIAPDTNIELSGYRITSSAPVTVVSGNICAYSVEDMSSRAAGTYISSPRSVPNYSTEYVVPPVKAPRSSGYDVQVVAGSNGTTVEIDGDVQQLDEGESAIAKFAGRTSATHVSCSLPCNVLQFTIGYHNSDGMFMMGVVPTTEFYTRAVFSTPEGVHNFVYDFHISVIVDNPAEVTDLVLDGVPFAPEWTTDGGYTYTTADVSRGYHVISSTQSRFVVYAYGQITYGSGAYGYDVRPEAEEILPPTTPAPAAPLPQYAITTEGTVVTVDESLVEPQCVMDYINQLDSQTKNMAASIDLLIGGEVCPNQKKGSISIVGALARVAYNLEVNLDSSQVDIEECGLDVGLYVSDGERWPHPIIPGTAACPAMELPPPPHFDPTTSHWVCPQEGDEDPEELADNMLVYQLQVADVMDTDDGTDLSIDCSVAYGQELSKQGVAMAAKIQGLVDSGALCDGNRTVAVLVPATTLAAIGAKVYYTVSMTSQPGPAVTFADFLECANEVFVYLRTTSNWPDPMLSPQPGCPALVTDAELLEDSGSGWSCVDRTTL